MAIGDSSIRIFYDVVTVLLAHLNIFKVRKQIVHFYVRIMSNSILTMMIMIIMMRIENWHKQFVIGISAAK